MSATGQPGTGTGQGPVPSTSHQSPAATLTGQSAAELPPGTLLADRFRIVSLLGMGGMGVVYRATDTALDIPVAVKLLRLELADRPGAFDRFRQELLLSRQISSPNVVRIHDIAQHEGRWLISMDLVEGEPLDRILDTRGPLPIDGALQIVRQIALGLAAAHARQVIHRDLKPSNILVDAGGSVTIVDFGIARSLGTRGLTQTGMVVGTPDYLSPEQARAEPVDSRSDLYTLGLLFYEMLAGRPPFSGGTSAESLTQRLTGPPPGIRKSRPDAPAWVERLLDRLLHTRPAHRLQSAEDVVRAIDQRRVPRDFRPGRRSMFAASGLVLAAAIALFVFRQAPAPGPVAASPPPERLVVLPVENRSGDPSMELALSGYTELLRQSLAMGTNIIVVDGERIEQAIAQLGLPDSQARDLDSATMLREARATLLLRPRFERVENGVAFSASLWRADAKTQQVVAETKPDLLTAASGFTRAVAAKLQPDSRFNVRLLPKSRKALDLYGEGLRHKRLGRLDLALAEFSAASALDPDFGAAWLAQARTSFLAGKVDASETAALRGLVLATPGPMHAEFMQWKGLATGASAATIASQQARVKAGPDDLDAVLRLAFLQGQGGQISPAITTLKGLLARDANDPRAWFLLGKFSIMQGDFRAAVDEHLVRALVLFKRGRNPFGEAETVNALGVGYARLGQADDASEQFRKAVELRRALDDRRGVASSLRNLAQQAIVQGRFSEAQAQLDEARALFLGLGDEEGLNAVDNELGLLAEERGDFVAAQAAFRRMLRGSEQAGDDYGVAESLNNIGFAQFQLGDYDSANVFWQQALSAYGKLDDPNGLARAQQNLGSLEIAKGRWSEARRLLEASLRTAEKHQMVEETAVSRYYLGELELLEGRLGTALKLADGSEKLFAERKDQRGLIDAGWLRARILFAANATALAEQAQDKLTPLLEGASAEQKTVAALVRADIAHRRLDVAAKNQALAEARELSEASGIQLLKLRAMISGNPGAPSLDEQIGRLGNLPLRLEWHEYSLRSSLAAGDHAAAATTYRQAQAVLAQYSDAFAALELHALGAEALTGIGDGLGAAVARSRARAAVERVRSDLPPGLRPAFDAAPRVREILEPGDGK